MTEHTQDEQTQGVTPESMTSTPELRTPYPGPRPFTGEETDIFFGRREHLKQVCQMLYDKRFVGIVGLSGCGKTSLVRAGLIPFLKRGHTEVEWRVAEMRPGTAPFFNLAEALLSKDALGNEAQAGVEEVFSFLRQDEHSLVQAFREASLAKTNLLVVVDQFEDIFWRGNREIQQEITEFVALLLTALRQTTAPIYVVLTLRAEFLGECAAFHGLPEWMNGSQFLAPLLSSDGLAKSIVEPVRVFGGNIEPRLLEHLLKDLETEPDCLPVLQHCLLRMWRRVAARGRQDSTSTPLTANMMMTVEDYEAVGKLKNAFSDHIEDLFRTLDQKQRGIAEHLFRYLTSRQSLPQHSLSSPARLWNVASIARVSTTEVMQVVDIFRHPDHQFITSYTKGHLKPDSVVDISYASLIRQWRRLREWLEPQPPKVYEPTGSRPFRTTGQRMQPPKKPKRLTRTLLLVGLIIASVIAGLAVGMWRSAKEQLAQALSQNLALEQKIMFDYMVITDPEGAIIPAVQDVYYIEADEELTIAFDQNYPAFQQVTLMYAADRGVVKPGKSSLSPIYIAPHLSGKDVMRIRMNDQVSGVKKEFLITFTIY